MPVSLPFLPSDTNYTLACPLGDQQILFDVRWNSRDEAFYMDMYESDDTVIALNIKIVVGIPLGRRSNHPFFDDHILSAVDTSGQGLDPGFDDLGTRVLVIVNTPEDFL
jgi:hypothetical protein